MNDQTSNHVRHVFSQEPLKRFAVALNRCPHPTALVEMRHRIAAALCVGAIVSGLMLLSDQSMDRWALVLTLAQAIVFTACSRDHLCGWTGALALQMPWVTYSLSTGQYAFVITAILVSLADVQAIRRTGQTKTFESNPIIDLQRRPPDSGHLTCKSATRRPTESYPTAQQQISVSIGRQHVQKAILDQADGTSGEGSF